PEPPPAENPMIPSTPSFRLDGKRALVTGAGRGIGLALAAALAEAGAAVTLCARTGSEVEAVAQEIRAGGGMAEAFALDVVNVDEVRRVIGGMPAFDVLVNNAGSNRPRPFVEATEEDFDALMRLNVRAAYFMAQTVALRMIDAGVAGSIINVSSQAGHVAAAGRSIYTLTKFALEGMTKAMAVELAPDRIRVNSLCPTFIETDMTRAALNDQNFRATVLARIKLGRVGTVEDLMGAAVFLASDASSLMTGSSLLIDGGWTAG
ncbi:MAG: SDR family NAD(P)-dependent oxidoreductase, partial [Lautropia sp.]